MIRWILFLEFSKWLQKKRAIYFISLAIEPFLEPLITTIITFENHYHYFCVGGHVSATWKVSFCRWRFPLTINSEKGQPSGNYLCAMFSASPPPPEKYVLPKKLPFVGKPSPVDPIGWHPLSVAFGFLFVGVVEVLHFHTFSINYSTKLRV